MHRKKAIETKYFGATDRLGARVRVKSQYFIKFVPWNYAVDTYQNHRTAMALVVSELGFPGPYHCAENAEGDGYVFIEAD
jgi:5-enolpyruvylshikimate-3-phosphate synthase